MNRLTASSVVAIAFMLSSQEGHSQTRSSPLPGSEAVVDETTIVSPSPFPPKNAAMPSEALLKLLQERQLDLDRREAAVRRDEERLRLLRLDIEGLLKKHEKQANVSAPAKPTGTALGPSMVHLTQAFETMPVEEAAQRIDKMSEAVALDLMSRLKSKTAGQILAAMNPTKAARLVEKLATERQRIAVSSESPSERK